VFLVITSDAFYGHKIDDFQGRENAIHVAQLNLDACRDKDAKAFALVIDMLTGEVVWKDGFQG
jgi:hypothetical protein